MKAKGMILSAIMMLVCWSGAWAGVVTEDSTMSKNLSNKELLVNKLWIQVDESNGIRLNEEHYYTSNGEQSIAIMHENRAENFPTIIENKFALSDSIITDLGKVKNSKNNNGSYLIVKEKKDNKKITSCYKIEEISECVLVLTKVHPTKESRKVFVVKNVLTPHTNDNKSIKEMLVGKQWYPKPGMNPNPHKTLGRMRGMLYFTMDSLKTEITKYNVSAYTEQQECKYTLESHSDINKKNAMHLVTELEFGASGEDGRIGTYEIIYISENMLILQNAGHYTFGRDKKPKPLELYVYLNE